LGVVLTVVLIVAGVGLMNHLIPRERSLSVSPCLTFSLGRWRWPMVVLVGSFLLLLIGVPLASLVFKAGVKVEPSDDGIRRFFSPLKCLRMIGSAPKYFSREFFWSLVICSASATLSTLLATILAWWARIGPRREIPRKGLVSRLAKTIFNRRFAILMLLAIIFATPGPVFAFGVIRLLNRPEWPWLYDLYDHSILAPTLVLILKSLPAAALVMGYAMQSIPGEILENAAVDGAGSWRQFWHIALPMRWKAMAVAWIIALAVSLGDLASVVLVHPPGVFLLSTTIFNLMHYGVEDQVAGACMALILIFSGLAIAAIILFRRMVKSR
jgi:ABC-type Fe3+ transport system permease subunit